MHIVTFKEVGPPVTPQEIKRLRRENMDFCRRMGQPVVLRHQWNEDDENAGLAQRCPACFDGVYDQPRNDCPVCFGFGWASVELTANPNLYIDRNGQLADQTPAAWSAVTGYTTGEIVYHAADTTDYVALAPSTGVEPGVTVGWQTSWAVHVPTTPTGWARQPRYGGFDQPILTWLVEPDVAVDVFRIADQGTLVRTYEAQGTAPWYPRLGDNDLCVNVDLALNDFSIVGTNDRFQLKIVQQVTVRGFGKAGRPRAQTQQAYLVEQTFQMAKFPDNSQIYNVPVDVD